LICRERRATTDLIDHFSEGDKDQWNLLGGKGVLRFCVASALPVAA
jgi:hypothetical protein